MENVTVEQVGSRWIARCSFEQRFIAKEAGFRWDAAKRQWFTTDGQVAAKLATPEAAKKLATEWEMLQARRSAAIEESRQAAADVEIACPEGLAYLPYQRAGIAAALGRESVLFADEMGLGKTIQAIGLINADPTIKKILVICPASLKLNWAREIRKWSVREFRIEIAEGSRLHPDFADVSIVNYDLLTKLEAKLKAVEWDLIISDEAHYLKNPKAKRTLVVFGRDEKKGEEGIAPLRGRRNAFLTGTPIPNRPVEGWGLFHYLAPGEFKSFWAYATRYCAAERNGFGWDLGGASNLPELQDKLRATCMVRRLKADVLKELPAKRRAIIEFEDATGIVAAELDAWERKEELVISLRAAVELAKASDNPTDYATAVGKLKEAAKAAFEEMSQLRHDTAVRKIPYVVEHLRNIVEQGAKVVVFAHHHDVIKAIAGEFGSKAVCVYGEVSMVDRQAAVDAFQTDPEVQVFVGGILAAGVGLTLTASAHVVFAELDWVPGNVTQAEDRCHRIGQRDMVLVEHLVLEGSLDARMAAILVEKQEVISAALDTQVEPEVDDVAVPIEHAATRSLTRAKVETEAAALTCEQIAAIGRGLRQLAALDEDHARAVNGVGFSKIDNYIGHSLAAASESGRGLTAKQAALGAKLVHKYRRQLGT